MGKIRSALEIAMEKTENIAIDENKIRQNQEDDKIRRIAGEYLAKEERDDSLLKTLEDHEGVALKRALKGLLLSSLSLPTYEVTDDRFSRLGAIMERVMGDNRNAMDLYGRITDFLMQYPKHRKQLLDALKKQLEPMLEEKSEELSKKLGREIHLSVEEDKETLEIIEQNLERLEKQYSENLDQAKKSLEAFF